MSQQTHPHHESGEVTTTTSYGCFHCNSTYELRPAYQKNVTVLSCGVKVTAVVR